MASQADRAKLSAARQPARLGPHERRVVRAPDPEHDIRLVERDGLEREAVRSMQTIAVTWHLTYTVDSMCHAWGSRRFETTDGSRNNFPIGISARASSTPEWLYELSACLERAGVAL